MSARPDPPSEREGRDPPIGFRRDPSETGAAPWLKPALLVLALVALVAIAIALATVGGDTLFADAIP